MLRIDRASSFCKRPSIETILSAVLQRTIYKYGQEPGSIKYPHTPMFLKGQ